jgi:hypothetical protein
MIMDLGGSVDAVLLALVHEFDSIFELVDTDLLCPLNGGSPLGVINDSGFGGGA